MRERLSYFIIILFISFIAWAYGNEYYKQKKTADRLLQNCKALNGSLDYYETQNGTIAARNQALQIKVSELSKVFPKADKELVNLKVKPNRVENYSESVIEQNKEIRTAIRDSVLQDSIHAKSFSFHDNFYSIKGLAIGDSQRINIHSIDTIIQVVYRGKRIRPWLWILSKRTLEQVIIAKNPNSSIVYDKTIQIVKQ
jgi:hypothetical protein